MRFQATQLASAREVVNHQGWTSFILEPEQELLKLSLTSFMDKSFYETMNDKLTRLREYCSKVPTEFLLKLSVWARNKWLRTVNQCMLIEWMTDKDFVKAFQSLVQRPDEILDMLWYYVLINWQHPEKLKLANKLKKAIKIKLQSFNEYQLSKYKGKGNVINLYDLVNITHAYSPAIDKLMKGELKPADTWEVEVSANWNTIESWTRLLEENKLWALAFIRNLRNMIQTWIWHDKLETYLWTIDFTKLFPFQTIQSVDVCVREVWLSTRSPLYKALEKKVYDSFTWFAKLFKWKVAVGVDISWSMHTAINSKSQLQRQIMAWYYGQWLQDHWADIYARWSRCYDATDFCIDDFMKFNEGTDINSLLQWIASTGKKYDTLFVITDEQSSIRIENSNIPNIIIRNIADYSHSIIPTFDRGYTYITWFNDAQFELIDDLRDISWLVKSINNITL